MRRLTFVGHVVDRTGRPNPGSSGDGGRGCRTELLSWQNGDQGACTEDLSTLKHQIEIIKFKTSPIQKRNLLIFNRLYYLRNT